MYRCGILHYGMMTVLTTATATSQDDTKCSGYTIRFGSTASGITAFCYTDPQALWLYWRMGERTRHRRGMA